MVKIDFQVVSIACIDRKLDIRINLEIYFYLDIHMVVTITINSIHEYLHNKNVSLYTW